MQLAIKTRKRPKLKAPPFFQVGNKTLFVTSEGNPQLREIRPLCVLDFYVHESCQRTGVGRFLFDHMLSEQSFLPAKLAYDRPSPKLLAFLKKHFGLYKYVPQTNNFVVFNEYFLGPERAGSSLKQRGFEETALKQDGSMRWNAALRNRVPEHQKRGSEECTQGAENERMRTCVRRNSGGGQIFESVDENAARALEGEQCSGSQSDSIFGEHAKQAPNIPMHGRRSRRGSSETGKTSNFVLERNVAALTKAIGDVWFCCFCSTVLFDQLAECISSAIIVCKGTFDSLRECSRRKESCSGNTR